MIDQNTGKLREEIKKEGKKVHFLSWGRALLVVLTIFLIVVIYIARPVYLDGSSMYPTLEDKDIGITNILAKTLGEPKRFDLVMVYNKAENKNLVKRVIGLPGETVQYRDDILYINSRPTSESFLDEEYMNTKTQNGKENFTGNYGPIKLKKDEYFLCGDNRPVSKDSRYNGPFLLKDIISRHVIIVYPF